MEVESINCMGNDLTVVNAARVSFDKNSDWGYEDTGEPVLKLSDQKLIKYLAEHGHWSPFSHPQATFRVKAPIFVARQLAKHQVGFSWNEVSRRYVDKPPEYWVPDNWRKKSKDKKQGSSDEIVEDFDLLFNQNTYKVFMGHALSLYKVMIDKGVCPEQARVVLPQSVYTEWYWTGSLYAWARMCNLRCKPDTQKETREIANKISDQMREIVPYSWEVLVDSPLRQCYNSDNC